MTKWEKHVQFHVNEYLLELPLTWLPLCLGIIGKYYSSARLRNSHVGLSRQVFVHIDEEHWEFNIHKSNLKRDNVYPSKESPILTLIYSQNLCLCLEQEQTIISIMAGNFREKATFFYFWLSMRILWGDFFNHLSSNPRWKEVIFPQ